MERFQVRDVVDMDVALHGKRFIVAEFALVAAVGCTVALVAASPWARVYAALFALNCLTFGWLAAVRPRRDPPGLRGVYALTGFAMLLLFVPLLFPLAAVLQRQRRMS
jgi:hypothetical protein